MLILTGRIHAPSTLYSFISSKFWIFVFTHLSVEPIGIVKIITVSRMRWTVPKSDQYEMFPVFLNSFQTAIMIWLTQQIQFSFINMTNIRLHINHQILLASFAWKQSFLCFTLLRFVLLIQQQNNRKNFVDYNSNNNNNNCVACSLFISLTIGIFFSHKLLIHRMKMRTSYGKSNAS